MSDVVVTVPKPLWFAWIDEGDAADSPYARPWDGQARYHFWVAAVGPSVVPGDRVYVVSHGRLRGYAPLVGIERPCVLNRYRACLLREGGAAAVTIPDPIPGFRGIRYRWWPREAEVPFPDWRTEGVE